jgi:superfamily II DNA or RNA helicase
MFRNREVPLGTLFLASCALGDAAESVSGYRAFKGALLPSVESSQSAESGPANSRKDQTPPSSPIEMFSELIETSEAAANKVDLSTLGRMRLANLLYQLCYRSFSGDVSRVIAELERVRNDADQELQLDRQLATDILRDVVPLLLQQLRREKDFEVPGSILFEPFGYQRAWVSAAQSGEYPLLVGAPGSGKTEMGVLLAASYLEGKNEELAKRADDEVPRKRPPRRVLWITAPSNISGTSSRIAKRISTPILQLTPELLKRSPDSLRVLLQEFSLISFTYSSNAAVWARRPEHFAVLKEWLHGGFQEDGHPSGLVIADEGHLLDNARSLRSQAVRALGAEKVAVLSGTPVQHRRENIATLLHTTLPGHYPNVDALRRALKHDKTVALAMFHQHATIIGIDEIARTFKPFSEMPAEEQLSRGLPCVPRVHERYKDFSLSADHSRRYINIAVGELGDDPSHIRSAHLRRFAKLRRLLASPTKLGAEPGHAMLQAVKEVAIPAMRRGEKVIVLGEHLDPLEFIARDPEMQRFGAALVTGSLSAEERSATVQRLSRDPSLMCAVGQIRVLGTGHDCLGVEHVIFIEPPRVVSDLLQGMSRHRRLVTKETLSLARSDVYVWYLRAQLDEDVVGLVPSQAHRDVLRQGSVYERAMDRMVAQAREYSELTSHPTKIKLAEDTTVSEVITVLSKDLEVLSKKREQFHELSDARLEELFIRYRSSEKEAWRKALADFVERALRIFRKDPTELAVALLPGPEALEIPVYCERGISPSRICAFEAHPDVVVREHCAKQVQRFGARFFSSRIEEIFPIIQRDIPIDIISLDTNGYMTPELFEMVVSWRMPQQGMLLKNALCGREQGEAAALLEAAGNDRRELDRILLRLAGTQLHQTLQIHDMPALIVAARHIEAVCRCVAEVLNSKTGHLLDDLTSLLMSYACGAHVRIREKHQFDYQTAGCSPFLSTFALLERLTLEPDRELAARALGEELRSLGLQCGSKVEALSVKVTKRAGVFRVEVSSGEVQAELLIPEAVISTTPYSRNEGEEEIVD